MEAMVLLHHELPDGTWHLDWMLERASDESHRLVTFRVDQRIDDPACEVFHAERLGDHRADYLAYEGLISRGRGAVRRLARGRCAILDLSARSLVAQIAWAGPARLARGRAERGDRWSFSLGVS